MKWKDKLIKDLVLSLESNNDWAVTLESALGKNEASIHLAIFNEPFLSMVFEGTKTIESRFSLNKVAPFARVTKGDIVIVKKSGADIEGIFKAGDVLYFSNLNQERLLQIESKYGRGIGWHIAPDFFDNKIANYLTLIYIENPYRIKAESKKNDRTAWTVLRSGFKNTLFDLAN